MRLVRGRHFHCHGCVGSRSASIALGSRRSVVLSIMAKKPTESRRKLIEFDAQTWHALNLLSREPMKTFQEARR